MAKRSFLEELRKDPLDTPTVFLRPDYAALEFDKEQRKKLKNSKRPRTSTEPPLTESQLPDPSWKPLNGRVPRIPKSPRAVTPLSPVLNVPSVKNDDLDANLALSPLTDWTPAVGSQQPPSSPQASHNDSIQSLSQPDSQNTGPYCPFCVPAGHENFASIFEDPEASCCQAHYEKVVFEIQMRLMRLDSDIRAADAHRAILSQERDHYHALLQDRHRFR
ncbi:hypothetical protein CC1G_10801 [Coprinopsis cinerea okayama7|uniref:Uncharacterized protein n=1 Tax=Coprinopsis cinerea (strain Okayama-7 / 130 / ATCC MYA-4618 / FGSC 9003) TaxID=240176 RepID=A8NMJ0_COPC7|nr:hypothetical protein CC1G_10801 [Coprinopsis cinerea okayama7\|eukprot:XP_001834927.1 hypothetical protein CC1G_10801 [Coprinopsis cinerea okayama7\